MSDAVTLERPGLRLSVHPRGAMIRELALELASGRWFQPLHRAPWVGTDEGDGLSGLMAGLAGEWPCIPFGTPTTALPDTWRTEPGWEDRWPHGYAANHDWTLREAADAIHAAINMPPDHPVASMERRVAPIDKGVRCELTARVRYDVTLPIGLHPVFRLPDDPEALEIGIEGAGPVFTHPEDPSPDPTPLAPGAVFDRLDRMTTVTGDRLDLTRLPLREPCEIRVMVLASGGSVRLRYRREQVEARLRYDAGAFPSIMLWISNRGRKAAPWNGRHRALGVEPVSAPFDLGVSAANGCTPLSAHGIPVGRRFRANQPFSTAYEITVAGLSIPAR